MNRSRLPWPCAWALGAALTACGESAGPQPDVPAGLVLEFDGLRIWQHQIDPLLAYVDSVDRQKGRRTAVAGVLDNHLIPLELARRAFAGQRAELRERAEALRRVVGDEGYPGLALRGHALAGGEAKQVWQRHELPMPLAAWAFDQDRVGQVSPVIETPQGFSLISTFHIERGGTRTDDSAECLQVPFYTHGPSEFDEWLAGARAAVAGKVTYVHPELRGALPPWMRAP